MTYMKEKQNTAKDETKNVRKNNNFKKKKITKQENQIMYKIRI